jgi:hypothetical protein
MIAGLARRGLIPTELSKWLIARLFRSSVKSDSWLDSSPVALRS